jgi:hypothetical protein
MKTVFIIFIVCFLSLGVKAQDRLVVFAGGDKSTGKGFALPRGISKFGVSYRRPHSQKTHLEFEGEFRVKWTGFGWNWKSWEGNGTDLSGYKNMVFHIALSPVRLTDLNIQLTSKNRDGKQDDMGPKVSILPAILKRGKYVKMVIPLKQLFGGTLDKTAIWGFNIGVYSDNATKCRILLDQVEFTK